MRPLVLPKPRSGAVQTRTLLVLLLLAAVAGLLFVLLNRSGPPASRLTKPAGPPELDRTKLVLTEGRLRVKDSAAPFTGFMLEHYPDGAMRSRSAVSNGILQGLSQGWFTNGQLQVTENCKEGVSDGLRTKWYASGAKQSEAGIVSGKSQGMFRKWHENGALSEQVEFVADQPQGVSLAYYPSGYFKARVIMKDGKPVEQTFWKDGEKKE